MKQFGTVKQYFNKFTTNSIKGFKNIYKIRPIYIIFIILCILLIINLYNKNRTTKFDSHNIESFQQNDKFVTKEGNDIYDEFYSNIYDDLVYDSQKNDFELKEIKRITHMNPNNTYVLDIGCGSGHHINGLNKQNIKCLGLDKSKYMITKAKKTYPQLEVETGDALQSIIYQPQTFTHIMSLYFTVYYIKNKMVFFKNCYDWLKPGGYLIIHLVNRDKFDPIINVSNPLHLVSPQKYAKQRITNSQVKFKDFQYKADFKYNKGDNIAYFEETFKDDKTGNIRKNNHIFYMETQKDILNMAKQNGFILNGKIDLVPIQYEYQYIYILQKPQ